MARPPLPPPPLLDPAWYPDPTGRYEARYWDGRRWTSHISHYGATGADPLLRARFDRWWLRGLFRVAAWAAFFGALWWAYDRYWPSDERDLVADEQVAGTGVLAVADLPPGWSPVSIPIVSPLTLVPDDEGTLAIEACQVFADDIDDAADEPRRQQSFESPAGTASVAHATVIGGNGDLAGSVLETLRDPETESCMTALWQAAPQADAGTLTVTSTMAMADPAFGDEAAWWRLTAAPQTGPQQFADMVTVRVDRALVEFVFVGTGEPVGVDIQRDVITLQTARLRSLLEALDAEDDSADCEPSTDGDSGEAGDDQDCPDPTPAADTTDTSDTSDTSEGSGSSDTGDTTDGG